MGAHTLEARRMTPAATPDDGAEGVEGNARLTGMVGGLLVVILAVQAFTLLGVGRMLTLHEFVGVVLVGPVVLKIATTSYRFVRYYTGARAYVRKGPPHPVLRLLGPLLVLSTVSLFATGLTLLAVGHNTGPLLLLHQASFFVWVGCLGIHVLAHIRRVPAALVGEFRRVGRPGGAPARRLALLASLLAGVVAASLLVGTSASFDRDHHQDRPATVGAPTVP